jgi:hypothetical protein
MVENIACLIHVAVLNAAIALANWLKRSNCIGRVVYVTTDNARIVRNRSGNPARGRNALGGIQAPAAWRRHDRIEISDCIGVSHIKCHRRGDTVYGHGTDHGRTGNIRFVQSKVIELAGGIDPGDVVPNWRR